MAIQYRRMPNNGARLTLTRTNDSFATPGKCVIGNGYTVIARFDRYHDALDALRIAGFTVQSDGTWKLTEVPR